MDSANVDDYRRSAREVQVSDWENKLRDAAKQQVTEHRTGSEEIADAPAEVETFYANVVMPAFEEVQGLLRQHERQVNISPVTGYSNQRSATITVLHNDSTELELSVRVEVDPSGSRASARWTMTDTQDGQRSSFEDNPFEDSSFFTSLSDITKDKIVDRFMDEYMPIFERSSRTSARHRVTQQE